MTRELRTNFLTRLRAHGPQLLDWAEERGQDAATGGHLAESELNRSDRNVTRLLHAWGEGQLAARDELMLVVYAELRRRAAARLRREPPGHMLQPSALVHETYLRLVGQRHTDWKNRAHFFGVASEMMRRILVDEARRRRMSKRSGGWGRVPLDETVGRSDPLEVDVLDLDAALRELASFDSRKSRVADLRFFAGLTLDETAQTLGISRATVEREWQAGRAWLYCRLTPSTRR